jgi:U3 small nucleolar RNA-associated protein MPP10
LDDKKNTAGLGELYEQDYVRAVTGVVDDRDAPIRELATAQFKALIAALDALSHGHYRPVPNIEDVTVKVDVPAILMEEAAPAFVSAASMRAPEEVYKAGTGAITVPEDETKNNKDNYVDDSDEDGGGKNAHQGLRVVLQAGGGFKSEAELTKEDRKRRRADKKRASKKRKVAAEENAAARAAAAGTARISNRKSEEEQQELRKLAKATKNSRSGGISNYSRSTKVFGQLQAERDAGGVGAGEGAAAAVANSGKSIRASGFKL